MGNIIKNIYSGLLNFIMPASCVSCGETISAEENYLCAKCFGMLEPYREAHPWKQEMINEGIIDNSLSAFWFKEGTPIQALFHALKYQNMKNAGLMLGKQTGKIIAEVIADPFSYIIPVPLHKSRHRDRTYNQSEYIAKGASDITSIPVLNRGLVRTRITGTQTKLNKAERKQNVSGAFEVNPEYAGKIRDKNIILIDDVITTGATMLECASALKKAAAGKVWICSAAYAELKINTA